MQGLKPSVLMGKLKQHLSPGFLRTTIFFWSCFLFACHHPARDGWSWQPHDSRGHGEGRGCPEVYSRRPRPYSRGHHDSAPAPKVAPPPAQISIPFRTLAMKCANFIITMSTGLTDVLHPVLGRKIYFAAEPFSVRRPI
jgi:hypothetical protein